MSSYWIWLVVSTASMEASSYFLGWTSPGKWQKLQALNCRYLYSLCWCLFRLHVFWVQTTRWQHVSPSYSHSNVQFHLKIPPITRKRMRASSLKINDLFQFIADLIPNRTEIIKTCLKAQPKYIYIWSYPLLMVIKSPYLATWLCPKTGYPRLPPISNDSSAFPLAKFIFRVYHISQFWTHTQKKIDCWLGTSKYAYILFIPNNVCSYTAVFWLIGKHFPACLINTYGTSPV